MPQRAAGNSLGGKLGIRAWGVTLALIVAASSAGAAVSSGSSGSRIRGGLLSTGGGSSGSGSHGLLGAAGQSVTGLSSGGWGDLLYHGGLTPYARSFAEGDSDGDGLPNACELAYPGILDPFDPGDADLDPDGDGMTNREECENGTDPGIADAQLPGPGPVWQWGLGLLLGGIGGWRTVRGRRSSRPAHS